MPMIPWWRPWRPSGPSAGSRSGSISIIRPIGSRGCRFDPLSAVRCGARLQHVYLSHLGATPVPPAGCGDRARRRSHGARVGSPRRSSRSWTGTELVLRIPQAGVHIAYDVAAALAVLVGLGIAPDHAARALAQVKPAFGRLEVAQAGDRRIVLGFVKNPTSYNTTLQTLACAGEPRQLLIAASNTPVDGEDFAWLWDVDFGRRPPAGAGHGQRDAGRRARQPAEVRRRRPQSIALSASSAGIRSCPGLHPARWPADDPGRLHADARAPQRAARAGLGRTLREG